VKLILTRFIFQRDIPLIEPAENWIIEDGSELKEGSFVYHAPVIENKETDTLWYSRYFVSHGNTPSCPLKFLR
jgi:hypothetical protein